MPTLTLTAVTPGSLTLAADALNTAWPLVCDETRVCDETLVCNNDGGLTAASAGTLTLTAV